MLNRRQFLFISAGALLATGFTFEQKIPRRRAVNFGLEDVMTQNPQWQTYGENLKRVNANGISLAVGRPEWLGFSWEKYPDSRASLVKETGKDYIQQAIKSLKPYLPQDYELTLTIDTLLPDWISKDNNLAGTKTSGERSSEFVSVSALSEGGKVGDRLVELAGELSSRYRPNRIALTELMFNDATFGDDDLGSYRKITGASDWPRRENGSIDETHPSIGQWRSKALASLLSRIKAETNKHSVRLDMDVRMPWDDPDHDRTESGHNYGILLGAADRIVLWNYFGENNKSPNYGGEVTKALNKKFPGRFTMSTGLWKQNDDIISAKDLEESLRTVAQENSDSVSVSPAYKLTPEHWNALERVWKKGQGQNYRTRGSFTSG